MKVTKIYILFFTGVFLIFMFSSSNISAFYRAVCSTEEGALGDEYSCCDAASNPEGIRELSKWENLAGGRDDCYAPKYPYSSMDCTATTIVYASDPPDISLETDCNNHGYPKITYE